MQLGNLACVYESASLPRHIGKEWLQKPTPLVAIQGMPNLHSALIDNLKQGIKVLSVHDRHAFPIDAKKRVNFEGYQPEGIMEADWAARMISLSPSALALLVEWKDGATLSAHKQETAALQAIGRFREEAHDAVSARDMRLIVVLVTNNLVQEDLVPNDFTVKNIARRSGLDPKHFLLFSTVQFTESLVRLHTLLQSTALDYYRGEAKRLKGLKHKVNKQTQPMLYVKHYFQTAYCCQVVHDNQGALKHLQMSYEFLQEVAQRAVNDPAQQTIVCEVKSLSYVLNLKIASVLFVLGRPTEAISQFKQHVASFTPILAYKGKFAFLAEKWKMEQYHAFGQLLDSQVSVRNRQNNPGYFYQAAAVFSGKRKQLVAALLEEYKAAPLVMAPANTVTWTNGPFLGLGAVGTVNTETDLSLHPLERKQHGSAGSSGGLLLDAYQDSERVLLSLLVQERDTEQPTHVIGLLTKAYECFKREKANRMILHIAFQMAVEYFNASNFQMAKKFFDRITKTYRSEKWYSVLTLILSYAFKCAQTLFLYKDVITYSLELMGSYSTEAHDHGQTYLQAIFRAMVAENALTGQVFQVPAETKLLDCQAHFMLKTNDQDTLLSESLHFDRNIAYFNQEFEFVFRIQANFPSSLTFQQIDVRFNNPAYRVLILPENSQGNTNLAINAIIAYDNTTFAKNQERVFRVRLKATTPVDFLQATSILFTVSHKLNQNVLPAAEQNINGGTDLTSFLVLQCPCSRLKETALDNMTPPVTLALDGQPVELLGIPLEEKKEQPGLQLQSDSPSSADEEEQEEEKTPELRPIVLESGIRIKAVKPRAFVEVSQAGPCLVGEKYPVQLLVHCSSDTIADGMLRLTKAPAPVQADSSSILGLDGKANVEAPAVEEEDVGVITYFVGQASAATLLPETADAAEMGGLFRGIEEGTSLSIPRLTPQGAATTAETVQDQAQTGADTEPAGLSTYAVTVYLQCSMAHVHHDLNVALVYQNKYGVSLTYEGQFSITVKPVFRTSFQVFGEIMFPLEQKSPSKPDTQAAQILHSRARRLKVGQPFVVQARVENVSPHSICVHSVVADLQKELDTNLHFQFNGVHAGEHQQDLLQASSSTVDIVLQSHEELSVYVSLVPLDIEGCDLQVPAQLVVAWTRALDVDQKAAGIPAEFVSSLVGRTERAKSMLRSRTASSVGKRRLLASDLAMTVDAARKPELSFSPVAVVVHESFPVINVGSPDVYATVTTVTECTYGASFLLTLTIFNRTDALQSVQLAPDYNKPDTKTWDAERPALCISGQKHGTFHLLGHTAKKLQYRVTPLTSGIVQLPFITLAWRSKHMGTVSPLLGSGDFGSVFVKPAIK